MNQRGERGKAVRHKIITELDDLGRKKFTLQQDNGSEEEPITERIVDLGERNQSNLIGRQNSLQLEKYIGKIQTNKKKKKKQVFYCEVCEEGFKCDIAYITHVNSPNHNRKLGMNMKVKAVSLQSVSAKLAMLQKNQQKLKKQQHNISNIIQKYGQKEEEDMGLNLKRQNPYKKRKNHKNTEQIMINVSTLQKLKEQQQANIQVNEQEQLMRQYGLPTSFGSKKIKK